MTYSDSTNISNALRAGSTNPISASSGTPESPELSGYLSLLQHFIFGTGMVASNDPTGQTYMMQFLVNIINNTSFLKDLQGTTANPPSNFDKNLYSYLTLLTDPQSGKTIQQMCSDSDAAQELYNDLQSGGPLASIQTSLQHLPALDYQCPLSSADQDTLSTNLELLLGGSGQMGQLSEFLDLEESGYTQGAQAEAQTIGGEINQLLNIVNNTAYSNDPFCVFLKEFLTQPIEGISTPTGNSLESFATAFTGTTPPTANQMSDFASFLTQNDNTALNLFENMATGPGPNNQGILYQMGLL